MPKAVDVVRFGDFELDVRAYELRRGGQPVKLERRPMDHPGIRHGDGGSGTGHFRTTGNARARGGRPDGQPACAILGGRDRWSRTNRLPRHFRPLPRVRHAVVRDRREHLYVREVMPID